MAFTFRQRAGKLNWKIISSVNVDNVIENSDTVELQSVIDIITFSEFQPVDVKANTVDSIAHLVNIMQLVIEYLLYCQESQYRLVQTMKEKNNALKHKIAVYKRELAAIEEDNKIYQRQLQLLKKSLAKTQNYLGQPLAPKIVSGGENLAKDSDGSTKPMNALIETIMQHEKDNREFLKSLLDDQRQTFFSEMSRLNREKDVSAFAPNSRDRDRESEESMRRTENAMQKMTSQLCNQLEALLQTTIRSMGDSSMKLIDTVNSLQQNNNHQQQQTQPRREPAVTQPQVRPKASTATSTSNSLEDSEQLKFAALLQGKEEQINYLKATLEAEREQSDRDKQQWEKTRKQLADNIHQLTSKLTMLSSDAAQGEQRLSQRCRSLTISVLCKNIMSADIRKQRMYFAHWCKHTNEQRELERTKEYSRVLTTANSSKEKRERELSHLLALEREKVLKLTEDIENSKLELNRLMLTKAPKLRVDSGTNTDDTRQLIENISVDSDYLHSSLEALLDRASNRITSTVKEEETVETMNRLASEISLRILTLR